MMDIIGSFQVFIMQKTKTKKKLYHWMFDIV